MSSTELLHDVFVESEVRGGIDEVPRRERQRIEGLAIQLRMARHQRLALDRPAHLDDAADFFVGEGAHVRVIGVIAGRRLQHSGGRTVTFSLLAMARDAVRFVQGASLFENGG